MEDSGSKNQPIEIEKGRLYWISDSKAPKSKTSKAFISVSMKFYVMKHFVMILAL